ncbi:unnamed protein product [Rotaria sordida]|uniref:Cullin family profile domain-containing protein n=1 Tax=Rotaria sordida TaxID=392033 RepID=A0A816E2N7_9BILA|nr:unnamed protein product [Rotaria sordida]CAF1642230.1 unnamed protein product [Rotaria sordida]
MFMKNSMLKATFDSFKDFYTHHHNGRKLILLDQYSKGEVQTCFTIQKYTLQVSIYQMIALLLFNEELNWTVEQIQNKIHIQTELLLQVLVSLLKSKILFSKEITEDFQDSNIKMNHKIELTKDFIRNVLILLIEKEYLQRNLNDKDILHYLN